MSKKEALVPNFRFSYSFLKQFTNNNLLLIEPDIIQFSDRGSIAPKRTEMITGESASAG